MYGLNEIQQMNQEATNKEQTMSKKRITITVETDEDINWDGVEVSVDACRPSGDVEVLDRTTRWFGGSTITFEVEEITPSALEQFKALPIGATFTWGIMAITYVKIAHDLMARPSHGACVSLASEILAIEVDPDDFTVIEEAE